MNHKRQITCPYCGAGIILQDSATNSDTSRVICDSCKHPITIYRSKAEALQHRDRSTKAASLEEAEFDTEAPFLEIIETEFTKPQRIMIPKGKSLFGRFNPKSSAQLQVLTADPSIDRQHAYFLLSKSNQLEVVDNDSMTGTFVNGSEIAQGDRHRLHSGDVLTFGATTAIVHLPYEDADKEL